MANFKPLKSRCRASFSAAEIGAQHLEKIDRENLILHGVQITLEGEAKGHGIFLDREFCDQVTAQGNAMGDAGVKVRFGHPAMCSDALGTYLGRAKSFRTVDVVRKDADGNEITAAGVLADVYLDKNADRTEWIMNMAETAPDTFGQSIVFTYSDWVVKDSDGVRHSYAEEVECEDKNKRISEEEWEKKSADGKFYAVLGKLLGSDFTDTPAATDGVFADRESLAAEATEMLEEHPQIKEVLKAHPKSVFEFLERAELTEVLSALESKRVSGIQSKMDSALAAKDLEIENFRTLLALANKGCEDAIAKLKEEINLKEQAEEKLGAALADVERLTGELTAMKSAFDESVKQLEALRKNHERLTGAALRPPMGNNKKDELAEKLAQAKTAEEREAIREQFKKN